MLIYKNKLYTFIRIKSETKEIMEVKIKFLHKNYYPLTEFF